MSNWSAACPVLGPMVGPVLCPLGSAMSLRRVYMPLCLRSACNSRLKDQGGSLNLYLGFLVAVCAESMLLCHVEILTVWLCCAGLSSMGTYARAERLRECWLALSITVNSWLTSCLRHSLLGDPVCRPCFLIWDMNRKPAVVV